MARVAEQLIERALNEQKDLPDLAKQFKVTKIEWDDKPLSGEFFFKGNGDAKAFAKAASKDHAAEFVGKSQGFYLVTVET